MVEEQHVTQYGGLMDPNCTWLENLLLHEYTECYLYYSFYEDETDRNIKAIWERHLMQEISHLHKAAELLQKYEGKEWQQVLNSGEFPELLKFHDTKDYVRNVLANQIELTADKEEFADIHDLPEGHEFFTYQDWVNGSSIRDVQSHVVIADHQKNNKKGEDYRDEERENPVSELRNRKKDNTTIGRTQ